MCELIKSTNISNPIFSIFLLLTLLPSLFVAVIFRFGHQLYYSFSFFLAISAVLIYFKAYKIRVYTDKLQKSYIHKKRECVFLPSDIRFEIADYRHYVMIPSVIIYNKNKMIGGLTFSSFENLENFVLKTKKAGYRWSQPDGNSSVWNKIRAIIKKY